MSIYSWNDTIEYSLNTHVKGLVHQQTQKSSLTEGMISELVYNDQHPIVDYLLLPLLRQFGDQSRWLLWLSPNKKLSKKWLAQSGLPLHKIMQLNHIDSITTIDAMEKALNSGNYSIVLGWLPELEDHDFTRLEKAALLGGSIGLIMRPQIINNIVNPRSRQLNLLKIQPNCYH
ncbi:SOS-induced cell division inhibitor SulA [Moellerella wisconsensis]|uniref:Cell division inhibitor SulA n=1 Tax=Moellerella wisconsensis ATCC 35017 TaxID=1354267 RepID=A0A0N0Z738_9GAMM|nr:SOS-induced cell division inhibitor SulA [Moellerella wisconsensis]KPD01879.1 cell division inhibitor [Moellerella wisconsensis ATCC 35017]VFS54076.1 Cell division inhibitor SulA [Moellerella wisconsensis]